MFYENIIVDSGSERRDFPKTTRISDLVRTVATFGDRPLENRLLTERTIAAERIVSLPMPSSKRTLVSKTKIFLLRLPENHWEVGWTYNRNSLTAEETRFTSYDVRLERPSVDMCHKNGCRRRRDMGSLKIHWKFSQRCKTYIFSIIVDFDDWDVCWGKSCDFTLHFRILYWTLSLLSLVSTSPNGKVVSVHDNSNQSESLYIF